MAVTGRIILTVFVLLLISSLKARAVEYTLPDLNGKPQSLQQYEGKWLIVNYWATWCGSCRKEFADLIDMHEANKDKDIVIVGINYENISQQQLKAFVEANKIPFPVLSSRPIPLTPLGRVPALPTTYIIDPAGNTVAGEVGVVTRKNLEDYIESKRTLVKYEKNKTGHEG